MAKRHPVFGDGPLGRPMRTLWGNQDWAEEFNRNYRLLIEHYDLIGMDGEEFYKSLCSLLIQDFVPGLQLEAEARRGGRPKTKNEKYFPMCIDLALRAKALERPNHPRPKVDICKELRSRIQREPNLAHPLRGKSLKAYIRALDHGRRLLGAREFVVRIQRDPRLMAHMRERAAAMYGQTNTRRAREKERE